MEQLLHYVWRHRLFQQDLKTIDGKIIEVIDVGLPNADSGPDFSNAKLKIDNETWIGNIEIHHTSKDWYKHKHENDKAYNSVILHIVEQANCEVYNSNQESIDQCEIKYPAHVKENMDYLLFSNVSLPCANYLADLSPFYVNSWINTLLLERLERKSNDIQRLLESFNNSWDDVFYVLLSRNFGFGLNSDSFEQLAKSLPLRYILKQADNIVQIEAFLLGQAGILDDINPTDEYTLKLQQEYTFLKSKYSLKPLDKSIFKNMRVRPTSSPQLRLVQLASILYNFQGFFSKMIATEDIGRIRLLFHHNASEYWQTHYTLGKASDKKSKYVGDKSLDIILINTVIPILFTYGKSIFDETYCDRALNFIEQINPESNSIIKSFTSCGLQVKSAYETQALIQLKREYCEKRKCLFCRIGYQLLSKK